MTDSRRSTRAHVRRVRNVVLGVFFLILGVIGIFIPVMPQLAFFFLSALFFSFVSPRLRRAMRRFRRRYPSLDKAYMRWREKARRKRRELIRKARHLREEIEEKVEEATGRHSSP